MNPEQQAFEKEFPVHIEFPVHWGEMDAFQHVNNVAYFRYFESARIAYMEQADIITTMQEKLIGPILASTECHYKKPLVYPDTIIVGVRTSEIQQYGFVQKYAVFSHQQNCITTLGTARIVMLSYKTHQKVAVSDALKEKLTQLDQTI